VTDGHVSLDGAMVQAVARMHGVELSVNESHVVAANVDTILCSFETAVARLRADDDPYLFRRLLEREGRR
jgi:hypothetical protein